MKKILLATVFTGLCATAFAGGHHMKDTPRGDSNPHYELEKHNKAKGHYRDHDGKKSRHDKDRKDYKHGSKDSRDGYNVHSSNIQYDPKVEQQYNREQELNKHKGPDAWP